MDVRHLRAFVIIAEEMHLTRAAQRLQIAQPHLTRILHHLEEELGASLFDRSNKRQLTLTPAGHTFLTRITPALELYEEAVQATRQVALGERGKLVIGYTAAAAFNIFPAILQVYEGDPHVELVSRDLGTQPFSAQIKALKAYHLDAAFVLNPFEEPDIAHECVIRSPLRVVLPATHRLTQLKAIPLTALAEEDWVMIARPMAPRFHIDFAQLCRQAGFELLIVRTTPQIHALVGHVAAGAGISVVTAWSEWALPRQDVIYRPLLDVSYEAELHVLWRADNRSPLMQNFLQIVREVRSAY